MAYFSVFSEKTLGLPSFFLPFIIILVLVIINIRMIIIIVTLNHSICRMLMILLPCGVFLIEPIIIGLTISASLLYKYSLLS